LCSYKATTKDVKAVSTKTFVLRNILPEEQNDPLIIHHRDGEYESTGLLYVILALIFVNEQRMKDGKSFSGALWIAWQN
jgi:hypothetical protein